MSDFPTKRILCPVDFSPQSGAALRVAGRVAAAFNAEVLVLHAHRLEAPVYFTAAQIQTLRKHLRRSEKAGHHFLRKFAERHLPAEVHGHVLLVDQEPVAAILRAIRDWRPDLVVMGTHGRTGLTRIRLGSVMESVFRQTGVPVLTVGPGVKLSTASRPIRRILSPTDLENTPQGAFQYAEKIAEATGAELVALHVAEGRQANGRTARKSRDDLCAWVPGGLRGRCSIREVVRKGRPAEQIMSEARDSRADLVVIDARRKKLLSSILFGSTTELVIRNSPSPVLSVVGEPHNRGAASGI